jgi:hypothetical protein
MKKYPLLFLTSCVFSIYLSAQCGGISFVTFHPLEYTNHKVLVKWASDTEDDTPDRFEIERSRDITQTYVVAGVISATKNTFGNTEYQFLDACPNTTNGDVYYRIAWYNTTNNNVCRSAWKLIVPDTQHGESFSCSSQCDVASFVVPDNKVCSGTSARFKILNSPGTVSWSLSPNNPYIATLTTVGPTDVKVTRVGDGFVTLVGTINTGCTRTFSVPLMIGSAPLENNGSSTYSVNSSTYSVTNAPLGTGNGFPQPWGGTAGVTVAIGSLPTVSSVNWSIATSGSPSITSFSQYNNGFNYSFNITLGQGTYSNYASFNYAAQTGCGVVNGNIGFSVYKSFSFRVSPAITSGNVQIETDNVSTMSVPQKGKELNIDKIYMVRVLDKSGAIVKNMEFKQGLASINLSLFDLKPGSYIISAFNGSTWSSRNILVQK